MIHLIDHANRHLYGRQLAQMHRLRREVFIDQRGWPLEIGPDGGEYDQGDDERAVYLLGLDEDGEVLIGIRGRPADDWSCTVDVLGRMLATDPEQFRSPTVWEMARYFAVGEAACGATGLRIGRELRLSLIEAALDAGMHTIIGVCDTYYFAPILQGGWRARALGEAQSYGEGDGIALALEVSDGAVADMRARLGSEEPVLLRVPEDAPWAVLEPHMIEAIHLMAIKECGGDYSKVRELALQSLRALTIRLCEDLYEQADAACRHLGTGT
jgi:acyl-homoserine lactone synthase